MIKVSFLARAAIGLAVILGGLGWMALTHETARWIRATCSLAITPS